MYHSRVGYYTSPRRSEDYRDPERERSPPNYQSRSSHRYRSPSPIEKGELSPGELSPRPRSSSNGPMETSRPIYGPNDSCGRGRSPSRRRSGSRQRVSSDSDSSLSPSPAHSRHAFHQYNSHNGVDSPRNRYSPRRSYQRNYRSPPRYRDLSPRGRAEPSDSYQRNHRDYHSSSGRREPVHSPGASRESRSIRDRSPSARRPYSGRRDLSPSRDYSPDRRRYEQSPPRSKYDRSPPHSTHGLRKTHQIPSQLIPPITLKAPRTLTKPGEDGSIIEYPGLLGPCAWRLIDTAPDQTSNQQDSSKSTKTFSVNCYYTKDNGLVESKPQSYVRGDPRRSKAAYAQIIQLHLDELVRSKSSTESSNDSKTAEDASSEPLKLVQDKYSVRADEFTNCGQVFIQDLPSAVEAKYLIKTLSIIGTVLDCAVASHPDTGVSLGFATLRFLFNKQAHDAVQNLNGTAIRLPKSSSKFVLRLSVDPKAVKYQEALQAKIKKIEEAKIAASKPPVVQPVNHSNNTRRYETERYETSYNRYPDSRNVPLQNKNIQNHTSNGVNTRDATKYNQNSLSVPDHLIRNQNQPQSIFAQYPFPQQHPSGLTCIVSSNGIFNPRGLLPVLEIVNLNVSTEQQEEALNSVFQTQNAVKIFKEYSSTSLVNNVPSLRWFVAFDTLEAREECLLSNDDFVLDNISLKFSPCYAPLLPTDIAAVYQIQTSRAVQQSKANAARQAGYDQQMAREKQLRQEQEQMLLSLALKEVQKATMNTLELIVANSIEDVISNALEKRNQAEASPVSQPESDSENESDYEPESEPPQTPKAQIVSKNVSTSTTAVQDQKMDVDVKPIKKQTTNSKPAKSVLPTLASLAAEALAAAELPNAPTRPKRPFILVMGPPSPALKKKAPAKKVATANVAAKSKKSSKDIDTLSSSNLVQKSKAKSTFFPKSGQESLVDILGIDPKLASKLPRKYYDPVLMNEDEEYEKEALKLWAIQYPELAKEEAEALAKEASQDSTQSPEELEKIDLDLWKHFSPTALGAEWVRTQPLGESARTQTQYCKDFGALRSPLAPNQQLALNLGYDLRFTETGSARTEGKIILTPEEKRRTRHRFSYDEVKGWTDLSLESNPTTATASGTSSRARQNRQDKRLIGGQWMSDLLKDNVLTSRKKRLKFGRSIIHDWGLYAMEFIPAGDLVIEYVGDIVRPKIADVREQKYNQQGIGSSYLFRIDDNNVVDATTKGNLARFLNHSCDPNCYAKIIPVEQSKRIVIYSKRDIQAGEEVTYDYKFPFEPEEFKVKCLCGTAKCRGTLN